MIDLALDSRIWRKSPAEIFAGFCVAMGGYVSDNSDCGDFSGSENTDDLEDICNTLDGDENAYKRLIERYQQKISSMMWRFSRNRNTHEELVQDVFVEVYLSLANYGQKSPFSHWLSRIATRVGYRYWKKQERKKRIATVTLEDWDQLSSVSPKSMEPDEAAELIHRLLGLLPPRDRLILSLRYLEECSVDDAAKRTGWSRTMVKVQTWRAKKKLKMLIEQTQKEE
ncbi:MAG: RNA polymerase sigma factor [Planctomycetes bacterium]|nr:RNA polymerase sigma factor [Planctomycetota bacterium]